MSEERTSEQREAADRLHDAIDALNKAYDDEGLLIEWVIVEVRHIARDDGTTATHQSLIQSDNLPQYRRIGLLDVGLTVARHEYVTENG